MSPRIGIVGAGPGGLSLARLLTERGFADITVLEKNARVGGKSLTVHHEGIGHEMGTCYVADGYVTTKRWMKEAGLQQHALKDHAIYTPSGDLVSFEDYVEGPGGLLGTGVQTLRYTAAWERFHRWELRGNPDDGRDDKGRLFREQVARPFGDWLADRELDAIARFAMRTMTIMGYGALDRVPTLYGLRWNMPSLLLSAVRHTVTEPVPGWQHLWTAMASHLDVRRSHLITGVKRGRVFEVETNQGALRFDHLVLSGPLDEAANFFPFTKEERAAWGIDGDVEWHEYMTTLVEADWFRDADTRSFARHAWDSPATEKGNLLVARRTGDKTAVARARSATRKSVYVCYQYATPSRSTEEQKAILLEDLQADGAKDCRVLTSSRWRYAPQLTPGAIRAGGISRMERQQGKGNLWVTGATASHEAVDNIVDYNERLVERMIAAFQGRDPSDPDLIERIAEERVLTFSSR